MARPSRARLASLASAAAPGGRRLSYSTLYAPREFTLERAPAAAWLHVGAETAPQPSRGVGICLKGVAKSFDGLVVFTDLSLRIGAGEFVAIVGRPGWGKTMLMRVIAGLEPVSGGQVAIDGEQLVAPRGDVRLLFQEPRLLPWRRVLGNVGIARGPDRHAHAEAVLKKVGLRKDAQAWPMMLSPVQSQRVALARALVSQPRALLLDEPFAALEAADRVEMGDLLLRMREEYGFTAVLMTDDVRGALTLADRIVVLKNGRVERDIVIGVPHRLRRASPALDHMERAILSEIERPDAP